LMKTPPRKIPKAPTVYNLICLDTPPRPRLTNVDFMKNLAAVLAPSGQKTADRQAADRQQTDSCCPPTATQEEEKEWRDDDDDGHRWDNLFPAL